MKHASPTCRYRWTTNPLRPMTGLTEPSEWTGTSSDPNDEQFGDVVETATLDSASEYDAVIVGEPYDGAVIGRRGPPTVRVQFARNWQARKPPSRYGAGGFHRRSRGRRRLGGRQCQRRVDPGDGSRGDESGLRRRRVPGVPRRRQLPSRFPTRSRYSTTTRSASSVSDAHLDCREPHDGPTSGTPYRQLHEAGLDEFAVVGARHFETSTTYVKYVQDEDGLILTPEEVSADPSGAIARARSRRWVVSTPST